MIIMFRTEIVLCIGNKESDRSWNNHLAPMKNFLECDSNSRLQLKQPFRIFDSAGWILVLLNLRVYWPGYFAQNSTEEQNSTLQPEVSRWRQSLDHLIQMCPMTTWGHQHQFRPVHLAKCEDAHGPRIGSLNSFINTLFIFIISWHLNKLFNFFFSWLLH